jgi:alpha-galactosidase
MQGKFVPSKPLANYPIQEVVKGDHQIIGIYDEYVVSLANSKNKFDIINGQLATSVVLDVAADFGTYHCMVYDCKGAVSATIEITLNQGVHKIEVPACGLIQLTLKN